MIDEKEVEKIEKDCENIIFTSINELSSQQTKLINLISMNARNLGYNVDIHNVGITLNNKIVELSHIFKDAGASIFVSDDLVSSSFIGMAVIEDLIEGAGQAGIKLIEYGATIRNMVDRKRKQSQALENSGTIKRLFTKIRSFFIPVKPIDLSLTEIEKNMLESFAQEHRDIDNKIWKYDLSDNVIRVITNRIKEREYKAYTVPALLEESVIPDLKKLGLDGLVPQLQQELIEEYKRRLPAPEIYKISEEDMYLYVPDFNKKNQTDGGGDLKQRTDIGIELGDKSKEKTPEQEGNNMHSEPER